MKTSLRVTWAIVLCALLPLSARAELAPGDKAPDFTLQTTDGKPVKLSDFVGKRAFVLAWYPKAFTGGCTEELKSFGDAELDLAKYDVAIYMVSFDKPEKNAEFAKSLNAKLPLLSDPTGATAEAFGNSGLGGMYAKRWTYYVDADGVVRYVDKDVKTATAAKDIAAKLGELGFPWK
ncbi:MAG TPA: peroxiredoxin [Myxococcota bacterium]|nr:peroxiredoxin [Myxococcota bacterium]